MNCYRVWMKDGYASLQNADDEDEAKRLAVEAAAKSIDGAAMTRTEKREATTVDYLENLTEKSNG
jgi:hypothetical protein